MNLEPRVLRCNDIAPEKTPALPKSYITAASLELSQSEADQRFQQKSAGC